MAGTKLFGIRHHGPGCARALLQGLEELRPDIIVMEGPADAQSAIGLAAHQQMIPPVALLLYPSDEPQRGVYYPFCEFSPEWQALRWALNNQVPVRLMDLPQAHQIALEKQAEQEARRQAEAWLEKQQAEQHQTDDHSAEGPNDIAAAISCENPESLPTDPSGPQEEPLTWRSDPLALLAEAAGYRDHELWWEEQIERRDDATELFEAIARAMQTVREEFPETRERDRLREAHMRKTIRAVRKEGHTTIAVICGAWHVPALADEALDGKRPDCKIKDDNDRLAGLPKVKTTVTWIPWTYSRLSYRSGYGAGVHSPGWYQLLWQSNSQAPTRWIATAARLLREKDLEASSASIIEARRLADALAAIRGLRSPGLTELNEAILSVFCHGEPTPLQLIRSRLEIGHVLGEVPEETPAVPLAQDLAALQKSLRFKPTTENKLHDFDLRKENDLAKSHLLHRLQLLGISWGELQKSGGRTSTFHEVWRVEWKPEFAVSVIEASVWGNTVAGAASGKVLGKAHEATDLPMVTSLLHAATLADLADVTQPLLQRIQSIAAVSADVRHLMEALPPLAQVTRYGDVRGTRSEQLAPLIVGMFERVVVGLSPACSSLDDDAAERMISSMSLVADAISVLNRADLNQEWQLALSRLLDSGVHALLRGWCCRFLLERSVIDEEELCRRANLALTPANPPAECAHWANGFLRGSGLLLLHHDAIWQVFDRWLASLTAESFTEMLPLLRRAFADFSGPERRQMGEKVKRLRTAGGAAPKRSAQPASDAQIHAARARRVLPVLAHIFGTPWPPATDSSPTTSSPQEQ